MKKWPKILLILLPVVFLSSMCETNNEYDIPYVRVNENLLLYGDLQGIGPGQSITVNGGVNGLIIYCEDLYTYHAYDRTCTQWPDHNEAVMPDADFTDIVYTCPECGSQYLLTQNADPISGPAVFGLHKYYSVLDGDILHVYN